MGARAVLGSPHGRAQAHRGFGSFGGPSRWITDDRRHHTALWMPIRVEHPGAVHRLPLTPLLRDPVQRPVARRDIAGRKEQHDGIRVLRNSEKPVSECGP